MRAKLEDNDLLLSMLRESVKYAHHDLALVAESFGFCGEELDAAFLEFLQRRAAQHLDRELREAAADENTDDARVAGLFACWVLCTQGPRAGETLREFSLRAFHAGWRAHACVGEPVQ